MADNEHPGGATARGEAARAQPRLKWDDSAMTTSYANVVNVSMTREECGLLFGTNLSIGIGGGDEVTIKLSDRIIMTPHAAKRQLLLLEANLRAYEERYGKLSVPAGAGASG